MKQKYNGNFYCFKKKSGFTLVEIIIAITIFSIGVLGTFSIFPKIILILGESKDKFIAFQLAQEGLEIVRNIRDNNFLSGVNWRNNLSDGNFLVQYNKNYLLSFSDTYLKLSSGNFYNYDNGTITKFKRKITITTLSSTTINIKVIVEYPGKMSPVIVEENLYDWK